MHVFRLNPGDDLRGGIEAYAEKGGLTAGAVVTCVGSLTKAALRMPGTLERKTWEGEFEILSLTGTISADGVHLHMSFGDAAGKVFGGHLMQGTTVRTTAEIVLTSVPYKLTRSHDEATGFKELQVN